MWLSRTRSTLDQYGVQADAVLHFTPMHKVLHIQLPDLQYVDMRVDFSVKVFATVVSISKELGIRHPEELSLLIPPTAKDIRKGKKPENKLHVQDTGRDSLNTSASSQAQNISGQRTPTPGTPQGTMKACKSSEHLEYQAADPLGYWNYKYPGVPYPSGTFRSPGTPASLQFNANDGGTPGAAANNHSFDNSLLLNGIEANGLALSPVAPPKEGLVRPRNFVEKARINSGWLYSSVSLMEQTIRESDTLMLRYKFLTFYDLNPKYDSIRINQIFNQAKWALLGEELECTEEEMMMFAALQLQAQLQALLPQPDLNASKEPDDIDAALNELQVSLEGSTLAGRSGDITAIPELGDYLRFMKPKKFTLKSFKPYWFVFKDTHIYQYSSKEEAHAMPLMNVNLVGCEVSPDVNISGLKFGIKLMIPTPEGMTEVWLRCENEHQYARWMAACRLACKGKTMADSTYESEVSSILAFLSMQAPAQTTAAVNPNQADIQPEHFVAPRFLKKYKTKQIAQRVLEAHANVSELALHEAKLNYIKAWQALPEFGITYFTVKFRGCKKEELLGIGLNRLIRMDINNGNSLKTWRYNSMKAWNVNWEVKEMLVQFEEDNVAFYCTCADCKVVHEYIGGYIFCSMRSKDSNQSLNEEMFHKLTGGWA
ncbi:PREDICTED: unc-112-related protein-like [Priapulus caudatus]|uniref:Unc-112-related protein-like n=1 Tax=Priapulus caudatus TaxID=37621 RepID=A0ABM1EYS9_PRICU|nr:PREDICTED: unc-112-related protein-like [Priapulus caudatus]